MSRKGRRNEIESEAVFDKARVRISFGFALLLVLLFLLICRLFYIQIICHTEFSESAYSQYELSLTGLYDSAASDEGSHDKSETVFVLIAADRNDDKLESLLDACHAKKITNVSARYDVYEISETQDRVLEKLRIMYDAYVFCNYMPEQSVMTVTGENIHRRIILYTDAAGRIMAGLPPKLQASF